MNDALWVEKYRPKTIADCILPEEYKNTFQQYVNNKTIPHLLLCGSQGVGKTTVAMALCQEVGCDYLVINGSDESGIDTFRMKISHYASSTSFDGGRKVIIIDEADYLNANSTQPAMRRAMEEFAKNCSFILTCNYRNRLIEPLQSRCAVIEFKIKPEEKQKIAAQFMKRAATILKQEGIKFSPPVIAELVKKHFPDFRRVLNELQRYSMNGVIDEGILAAIVDTNLDTLVTSLRNQNFSEMRKWVGENSNNDTNLIYRKIYDSLYDVMDKSTIPNAVVILAKYQYQSAFVADQELNLAACLTELMAECNFNG